MAHDPAGRRLRVLVRTAGLGDVLMALCAANAIRHTTGDKVMLVTAPQHRDIAAACPDIEQVACSAAEFEAIRAAAGDDEIAVTQLGSPSFGIAREHQVDAYLRAVGIEAAPEHKALHLDLAEDDLQQARALLARHPRPSSGRARILVHPAAGDPNRTWPAERWMELTQALIADGHQVVQIGAGRPGDAHGVHELVGPALAGSARFVDAANRLSARATLALMREADLLVSSDSGPVQLAGATDIGIVGLYSVVPGRNRLPFRHGEAMWNARAVEPVCRSFPCYDRMHDPAVMAPFVQAIRSGALDGGRLLSEWCPEDKSYRCMRAEIGVAQVMEACAGLLSC